MNDRPNHKPKAGGLLFSVDHCALRRLFLFFILGLGLVTSGHAWAQSADPKLQEKPEASETKEANASSQESAEETAEETAISESPRDTLGGSGLKDRKLSVIFEQFVPSETISADNAVPFPTDI